MKKNSLLVRYMCRAAIGLKRSVATLAVAAVLAFLSAQLSWANTFHAPQRAQTVAEAAAALVGADVIILGEVHDNMRHHQAQAELVTVLQPTALVWEMITKEQAELLTPQILQDADETARRLQWEASGWPDFSLYAPVFKAAQVLPHFGAWVPRSASQAALKSGVASYFGADAQRFGLDRPLPEAEQGAREAEQMVNHCNALPDHVLPMLVDVQRLRDASLAAAVERAILQQGGPVVVITGNGHARLDRGLAVYLQRAMPELEVRALGQLEGEVTQGFFDVVLSTPAMERPDPCLAFAKSD